MHEKTQKAFDVLEGAIEDEIFDLQEEVEELRSHKETLDRAQELTTEISRRLSLSLDPGPTEADFRELLSLLVEES